MSSAPTHSLYECLTFVIRMPCDNANLPCSKLQPPKKPQPTLPRLILSHFTTLLHLIKSLPSTTSSISNPSSSDAGGLLLTAVGESTKLLPWIMGSKKHLRSYLKVLLDLWSTASDSVRIQAFLGIRKVFEGGDDVVKELCLRVSRSFRSSLETGSNLIIYDVRTYTNPFYRP